MRLKFWIVSFSESILQVVRGWWLYIWSHFEFGLVGRFMVIGGKISVEATLLQKLVFLE